MTLSALRAHIGSQRPDEYRETRSGVFLFDGQPSLYHEWEFRTLARHHAAKEEDRKGLGCKILEGLTGDAYLTAYDLGIETLSKADGTLTLVEAMKKAVFPHMADEAKELYRHGQKTDGLLARQGGESMTAYVSRRRRWYISLQALDKNIAISENIRADLLLELSGLDRDKQLLINTSVGNVSDFEKIAEALVKQHPRIHHKERRQLKPRTFGRGKGRGRGRGRRGRSWRGAYPAAEDGEGSEAPYDVEDGDEEETVPAAHLNNYREEDYEEEPHDDYGDQDYDSDDNAANVATGDLEADEAQEIEDLQLDCLTAYLATDWFDDQNDDYAEMVADAAQTETAAYVLHRKGKGKGLRTRRRFKSSYRPRASHLSIEDRRKKLKEIKMRSTCKKCGQKGHWAGDPECKYTIKKPHFPSKGKSKGGKRGAKLATLEDTSTPSLDAQDGYFAAFLAQGITLDSDDDHHPKCRCAHMHAGASSDQPTGDVILGGEIATEESVMATPGANQILKTDPRMQDSYHGKEFGWILWHHRDHIHYIKERLGPLTAHPNSMKLVDWYHKYFCLSTSGLCHKSTAESSRSTRSVARDNPPPPPPDPVGPGRKPKPYSKISHIVRKPDCTPSCKPETISYAGSNAYILRSTCLVCGKKDQADRLPESVDPATCTHHVTTSSGSSNTHHRVFCKLCRTLLSEETQASYKERQKMAEAAKYVAKEDLRDFYTEDTPLTHAEATRVLEHFITMQTNSLSTGQVSYSSKEMMSLLEDSISIVVNERQMMTG